MAEFAHEACGPASSEPVGIALQRANRPASSDKGKLRVFISYSRDDLKFADQLDDALAACGFECLIDREGISGGEAWRRRLGNLISEADTIGFVLSPSSARSDTCNWEVDEAARLNKRILPIVCRPLEGVSPPPRLRELNYIFFYEEPKMLGSGFGNGLAKLIAALNTDFIWLREHTRYLQRAMEWDAGGRPTDRLLSGNDILEAKAWAARRPKGAPEPTALHLEFIRASEEEAEARLSTQRKQLEAVATAQAARETALHDREEAVKQAAEAQQQAADAQRRRTKIRNIALAAVSSLAAIALMFALAAEYQREATDMQRQQADAILSRATTIISNLQGGMDSETKQEAFALFQAGAKHGDAISMGNVGVSYEKGLGVARDYAQAREWYEKAATNGDARGMSFLGHLYSDGLGVTQDYAKARKWFEKAAAKDNPTAMFGLGVLYQQGYGVPQDYVKAREWFEKAAAGGHKDAMTSLGVLYENGSGVARDYTKAREWYEEAAAKGDEYAMFNLGLLYARGQGVAKDYAMAREWFEKAAAKDSADAMVNLGTLYANAYGVPQDYVKAREWLEKAAAKDSADAMFNLGLLYEHGQGVARDYAMARAWYEKAAANGDARGMKFLGHLYSNGLGVTQDYAKAREWHEKAAANGEATSMVALGMFYEYGNGVTQDYAKAREWYEKAAAQGDELAEMALEQLPIREAEKAGRYTEALRLAEVVAAKVEAAEVKRDGKPGNETALELQTLTWDALRAKEFTKAFTVAARAHALFPDNLEIETNRAHALMFIGHDEEAKALYLAHKGEPVSEAGKLWEQSIAEDFAELRKAGLTHLMMADIEKELGISN